MDRLARRAIAGHDFPRGGDLAGGEAGDLLPCDTDVGKHVIVELGEFGVGVAAHWRPDKALAGRADRPPQHADHTGEHFATQNFSLPQDPDLVKGRRPFDPEYSIVAFRGIQSI